MLITLTYPQQVFLLTLAHARNDGKIRFNDNWAKDMEAAGRLTSLEAHFIGLLGEAATAIVLGTRIDRRIHGGDKNEGDLTLAGGQTVQVKTRARRGWDFALSTGDYRELKADLGVLCWPGPNEPELQGLISKTDTPARETVAIDVYGIAPRERIVRHGEIKEYKAGYGLRLTCAPGHFARLRRVYTAEETARVFKLPPVPHAA